MGEWEEEEEANAENIALKIPGNCKKLSAPRVSGAADRSLCPVT